MKWLKKIYHKINELIFYINGMKPWKRGYTHYKVKKIKEALNNGKFNAKELEKGYGFRLDERVVEYPWFLSRLPEGAGKLLDAGSVLNFEFLLEHNKLKSKKVFISTLAPESFCFWKQSTSYVYEDLRDSAFKNDCFDYIASLSTIEHIGLDNTMLYTAETSKNENVGSSCLVAVQEYKRMLKPGGVLYLSFPFGKHENHGWFQIFDANMLDEVISAFGPSACNEFHYRYEPDGWRSSSREDSKDATYFDIHKRQDYDSDYAAASRAIVCLELIK